MDYYLKLVSQIFKVSESDNTKIFILTMEFQWDLSNVAADNSGNLGLIFYCFLWENISVEDQVQIEEVLEKIDCSFLIKGVRRMGRYYPGRKRKVLITFQSPWEARLVIAKVIENNLF